LSYFKKSGDNGNSLEKVAHEHKKSFEKVALFPRKSFEKVALSLKKFLLLKLKRPQYGRCTAGIVFYIL